MGIWRNICDFFKGYSEYRDSLEALIAYLPEGDLRTLLYWQKKWIPYTKDVDKRGLDNYNGADLTIKSKGGDCESIAAVYSEVIRWWYGWESWHVCFVFIDDRDGKTKAHDVAYFVTPDGLRGWIDGQVYWGGYAEMFAFYKGHGWGITDWWTVNDIGQVVSEVE